MKKGPTTSHGRELIQSIQLYLKFYSTKNKMVKTSGFDRSDLNVKEKSTVKA